MKEMTETELNKNIFLINVFNFTDLLSTLFFLRFTTLVEANPLIANLIKHGLYTELIVIKIILMALISLMLFWAYKYTRVTKTFPKYKPFYHFNEKMLRWCIKGTWMVFLFITVWNVTLSIIDLNMWW